MPSKLCPQRPRPLPQRATGGNFLEAFRFRPQRSPLEPQTFRSELSVQLLMMGLIAIVLEAIVAGDIAGASVTNCVSRLDDILPTSYPFLDESRASRRMIIKDDLGCPHTPFMCQPAPRNTDV